MKSFFKQPDKRAILQENLRSATVTEKPEEKKALSKEVDRYIKSIREFETDTIDGLKKSARTAWKVAIACGCLAFLAVGALIGLTPLKTVKPYVIRVDNNTGYADVATPIGDAKESYGQEIDKYFLAKFVINRESYDWLTIQNMHDTVNLLAANNVYSQYDNIIKNKTFSPLYMLKDDKRVLVKVVSVSFIGDVAQVRFVKYVQNRDGTKAPEFAPSSWLATITYDYQKNITLEKNRIINPLGFQATSYRVDAENVEIAK